MLVTKKKTERRAIQSVRYVIKLLVVYHTKGDLSMEIKAVLTDDELIITDKYGASMIISKYVHLNSKGEYIERLQMYPLNSEELDDRDDYTIDVPISEFDGVIDVIKDRFGLKTKEIKK